MEKLKELRNSLNLTYAEIAKMIGISKAYYWQIENETRGLSYSMAVKIANNFNLKPDELFYEDIKNKTN